MTRLTKMALLLLVVGLTAVALPPMSPAQVAVGISVHIGPPALPVYPQPICPGPGYIWTPGYWAYGPDGYYWVPGTWVMAPEVGVLWTPGYWGFAGGLYVWHAGYWGPHVGFYGGINYGYGYGGVGFVGGEWRGRVFAYNTAVTNVNTTIIHNTYVNNTVVNRTVVNNVSYNGGPHGVHAEPSFGERQVMNEHHFQPTSMQTQHEHMARNDHAMLASFNHGSPAVAATARPGVFHGQGVVGAHAANMNANANRPNSNGNMHNDRPPSGRNESFNSNANRPNSMNAHSVDHPQNAARPENVHSGNQPNYNNNHPNTSHQPQPQQHQMQPQHQSQPEHQSQPQHQNQSRAPEQETRPVGHQGHGR